MSLKIAIVGCGKIADAHVEEIRKIPSVQLVAVCDLDPIMAEQLASRFAVPRWYSDAAKMLEVETPDVLHITTPPQSHLALTRQAVAAGYHVYLEKPVAPRHCDAEAIIAAAVSAGRKLTVNYWPNFEVQALELRRLLAPEVGLHRSWRVCGSLRSLALQRGSPSRNCAHRAGARAKGILMGVRQPRV